MLFMLLFNAFQHDEWPSMILFSYEVACTLVMRCANGSAHLGLRWFARFPSPCAGIVRSLSCVILVIRAHIFSLAGCYDRSVSISGRIERNSYVSMQWTASIRLFKSDPLTAIQT